LFDEWMDKRITELSEYLQSSIAVFVCYVSIEGYQWTDIAPCVQWMSVFADVLRDAGATPVKFFDRISSTETHTLQTHVVNSTTLVID
jgi:hypothetical protein